MQKVAREEDVDEQIEKGARCLVPKLGVEVGW